MTYFVCYERLKELASKNIPNFGDLTFGFYLTFSSVSSAFAASISNAVDVVKTRVQISGKSSLFVLQDLIYKEGLKSFTKGLGARILWITPSVSISMTTYELFKIYGVTF